MELMGRLDGITSREDAYHINFFFWEEQREPLKKLLLDIDYPVARTFRDFIFLKAMESKLGPLPLSAVLEDLLGQSAEMRMGYMIGTLTESYAQRIDGGKPGKWAEVDKQFDSDFYNDSLPITEVARTSNMAALHTARGFYQWKQWNAVLDGRTRANHRAAHGQIVPIGGYFAVGLELMDAPGDFSAGPAETQNCRCTVDFFKDDEVASGWYRPSGD